MKKKILFVTNNMEGGGAEKVLQIIANHINRDRFDITIYSVHEPGNLHNWPDDIKYHSIFKHKASNAWSPFINRIGNKLKIIIYKHFSPSVFYRLFIRGKYDTEIAFIEGYSTRIVAGSNNPKSKKIAWLHIDMNENHWSKIAFKSNTEEIRCYRRFNQVVGVSKNVAVSINKLYSELDIANVIYNPIDENDIKRKAASYSPSIKQDGYFTLISVGRLVNQKGYDRIIPIISKLKDNGYKIRLFIIGEGKERMVLESLINKHNLVNEIILAGYKDNPYPYFAEADAFICSSRSEGFSTAVTEALILGLPVITTNCAGMSELLGENSEYGIITENDDDSLYEGLLKLMDSDVYNYYKTQAEIRGRNFKLNNLIEILEGIL